MADGIKYCRQCGKQLNKDAKFCRYCGYRFEAVQEVKAAVNLCPQCGNENAAGAKFCRYCGAGLAGAEAGAAAIYEKSNTARQETVPQIPGLKMSAASEPGEFDYGDIDLKSIAVGAAGKAASAAMAKAPGIELLSPAKVLGNSIGGFLKGIVSLVRDPKSAIVPLIFALLWIVLAFLRDSDLLPVRVLSWLTFAEGGLDRDSIGGMLGGIIGKASVVTVFASLFRGGIGSFFKGLKTLITGNGERRSILDMLLGIIVGILLYIAFVGIKNMSPGTSMAGIAGMILSIEALGGSYGISGQLVRSFASKVQDGVRIERPSRAAGLLSGLALGFGIGMAALPFIV